MRVMRATHIPSPLDTQRAAMQRFGALWQSSSGLKSLPYQRVIGAERILPDAQRAAQQLLGRAGLPARPPQRRQIGQRQRHLRMESMLINKGSSYIASWATRLPRTLGVCVHARACPLEKPCIRTRSCTLLPAGGLGRSYWPGVGDVHVPAGEWHPGCTP